jgi:HEAT repeat protein
LSAADASVLREYAAETLAIIGQKAYFAAPLLVRVVRDTSETESVRRKAIVALGAIGGAANVAIPALIETMEFESPTLRGAAAEALPKLGPAVVPVLRQYLQHERVELRQLAAEGLGQMGQGAASAVGQLLRCLDSDEQDLPRIACCEALHAIGVEPARYAEPLIALLASEDRQVRMRAMRLLVTIGGQLGPYLESLRRMQNDPRPHARAVARKALEKIDG